MNPARSLIRGKGGDRLREASGKFQPNPGYDFPNKNQLICDSLAHELPVQSTSKPMNDNTAKSVQTDNYPVDELPEQAHKKGAEPYGPAPLSSQSSHEHKHIHAGFTHSSLENSLLQSPDTAGADAGADAAADAVFVVGIVFHRTVFLLRPDDGPFGAGLQTHGTIAAGTAGNTAADLVLGIGDPEASAVLRHEQFPAQLLLGDHYRFLFRNQFPAAKVGVNGNLWGQLILFDFYVTNVKKSNPPPLPHCPPSH